jgi:DNA repair exonuclease SbcCD ATPase subunit
MLRESQEMLDTIPLSVDQRRKLEGAVLSLQGRIQECDQRLIDDELRLEQSLEMDKACGPVLEDLTARLERDEQAVEQWIEAEQRQDVTPVPGVVDTGANVSVPGHSRGPREDINEKFEALQNRLDDMHQLTTFDNDLFHDMVNAELGLCVSRTMAKNVLEATELYSLELLEEEFKGLVEKLDESERKVRVLEAREEARAEELKKWMKEAALVCLSFTFLVYF